MARKAISGETFRELRERFGLTLDQIATRAAADLGREGAAPVAALRRKLVRLGAAERTRICEDEAEAIAGVLRVRCGDLAEPLAWAWVAETGALVSLGLRLLTFSSVIRAHEARDLVTSVVGPEASGMKRAILGRIGRATTAEAIRLTFGDDLSERQRNGLVIHNPGPELLAELVLAHCVTQAREAEAREAAARSLANMTSAGAAAGLTLIDLEALAEHRLAVGVGTPEQRIAWEREHASLCEGVAAFVREWGKLADAEDAELVA